MKSYKLYKNEKKLQRTESFIDSKQTIQNGVSKGASYLIATNILSLRHSEVKRGWESMLQLQVKVLDVSTGEILATENITSEYVEPSKLVLDARSKFASKKEIKSMEQRTEKLKEIKSQRNILISIKKQTLFLQNVPLKYLSSYIGVTPQALSRIRKEIN